jgi:hypothetical protein
LFQHAEEIAKAKRIRRAEESHKQHVAEMRALAAREEQAWRELDHLLGQGRKIASVYDDATARLMKLKQLAEFQHTEHVFQKRIRAMAEKYANRHALIRRWKNQALV